MTPKKTITTIEAIGNIGFVVALTGDGQGNHVVEAVNEKSGERFVVRSADTVLAVDAVKGFRYPHAGPIPCP